MSDERWTSPLGTRYASPAMRAEPYRRSGLSRASGADDDDGASGARTRDLRLAKPALSQTELWPLGKVILGPPL